METYYVTETRGWAPYSETCMGQQWKTPWIKDYDLSRAMYLRVKEKTKMQPPGSAEGFKVLNSHPPDVLLWSLQARGVSCLGADRAKGAIRPPKTSCVSFRFAGGVSVYPQLELSLWPQRHSPGPALPMQRHWPSSFGWGCWWGHLPYWLSLPVEPWLTGPAKPVSDPGLILE